MRLGASWFFDSPGPDEWVAAIKAKGYSAAYFPPSAADGEDRCVAYAQAAERADIVIAEVGAWSNPLSPDEETRKAAVANCKAQLALADRVGARCCVNIAGSRGAKWDGPDPLNLTAETFDMIVESVRDIIDSAKPTRTYYTLETMPTMYPDSTESYLELIAAIDRDRFAVHFDAVNLVCSPQRYYASGELIREFVRKLGPKIRSCHGKDVLLDQRFLVHLDEVPIGTGGLDLRALLTELSRLDPDTPLILEHLATEAEYDAAAAHVRSVAAEVGVKLA